MSATMSRLDPRPGRGVGLRWSLSLGVALFCAAYVAGRTSRPFTAREPGARQALYYVDPMHPAYRSEKPGKAPDCGMDLEPVYAGIAGPAAAIGLGNIRLTPDQEQA